MAKRDSRKAQTETVTLELLRAFFERTPDIKTITIPPIEDLAAFLAKRMTYKQAREECLVLAVISELSLAAHRPSRTTTPSRKLARYTMVVRQTLAAERHPSGGKNIRGAVSLPPADNPRIHRFISDEPKSRTDKGLTMRQITRMALVDALVAAGYRFSQLDKLIIRFLILGRGYEGIAAMFARDVTETIVLERFYALGKDRYAAASDTNLGRIIEKLTKGCSTPEEAMRRIVFLSDPETIETEARFVLSDVHRLLHGATNAKKKRKRTPKHK